MLKRVNFLESQLIVCFGLLKPLFQGSTMLDPWFMAVILLLWMYGVLGVLRREENGKYKNRKLGISGHI